jgi:hypothetical protein
MEFKRSRTFLGNYMGLSLPKMQMVKENEKGILLER